MISANVSSLPNTVTPFAQPAQPISPETDKVNIASSIKPVEPLASVSVSVNNPASPPVVYSLGATRAAPAVQPASDAPVVAPNENSPAPPVDEGADEAPAIIFPQIKGSEDSGQDSVTQPQAGRVPREADNSAQEDRPPGQSDSDSPANTDNPAAEQQNATIIRELQARDREVRLHEAQHKSVGGQHAGSVSFSYQTGPNGRQYAIGGEVEISLSEVPNNPQATIDKMQTVRAAALAPAEPSTQDRSVAATATRIILQAQQELAQNREEARQQALQEQEQRAEARKAAQSETADTSEEIQTYKNFFELGQRYEQGLVPDINLDEVV